jgi:hypothetical protein
MDPKSGPLANFGVLLGLRKQKSYEQNENVIAARSMASLEYEDDNDYQDGVRRPWDL